jgi:hypothetical protein
MASDFVTNRRVGTPGRGEFGNQLFGIAAALGYAYKHNCRAFFSPWVCQMSGRDYSVLYPKLNYRSDIIPLNFYIQPSFRYDEIPAQPSLDVEGGFQSEKYFLESREKIRDVFTEPVEIAPQVNDFLNSNKLDDYGAMHLRFYDRDVIDTNNLHIISTLPEDYFIKAATNFKIGRKIVLVSNNKTHATIFAQRHLNHADVVVSSNSDSLVDFYILTRASELVISNSSYGWWAAYLNHQTNQIYAPLKTKWFSYPTRLDPFWSTQDLLPEHFIEIPF